MSRIGLLSPVILQAMVFAAEAWAPPREYHWHPHPSSPGTKQTGAATIKRQAKKRRNRK